VPQTQGCALGYRKTALQAWIANRRTAQTKNTPQRPPGPTGFVGNDKASARATVPLLCLTAEKLGV